MANRGPKTGSAPAALVLRESFGDRKLPDISRKITACVACRKRKVKCHMDESKPPCTRCKTRGLPCTVNKSIQMLLENDVSWKEAMEQRLQRLEEVLTSKRLNNGNSDVVMAFDDNERSVPNKAPTSNVRCSQDTQSHEVSKGSLSTDGVLNLSCSLGAFPASSMNLSASIQPQSRTASSTDFISRGVLNEAAAEVHFNFFQEHLNKYIYDLLSSKDTLSAIRAKSSLLTIAVCTTAAFCAGSSDLQALLEQLKQDVASKLFSSDYTFDDVRALCIGSFWLNETSAALNSLAVRIATELNLHRCIAKIPFVKRECYDRTRLYFVVFVCDHHCSLSNGRPPMTRDFGSLKNARSFLQSEYSTATDLKLISQVELWSISTGVFDMYGADIETSSVQSTSTAIAKFGSKYDNWHSEWKQVMSLMLSPKLMSLTSLDLYYHGAKLSLFSHVFRGSSQRDRTPPINAHGLDQFARQATDSALSIIGSVIDDTSTNEWPTQLPTYLITMVGFACVFLFRISSQSQFHMYQESTFQSLRRLHDLLQSCQSITDSAHPWSRITHSLAMAMADYTTNPGNHYSQEESELVSTNDLILDPGLFDLNLFEEDEHWLASHSQSESLPFSV